MSDIYAAWIDKYHVDGFRIDTAQHETRKRFWQQFVPAILKRARADGIPNFHMFGEVSTSEMDPAHTAVNTRVDKLRQSSTSPSRERWSMSSREAVARS